ncbi:transposase [uncultured Boseongicola sp.]|uniref:transposase n=1 Tax=uncultured Boseongicola sp. TaxID=1648499 RepID=UPI00262892C9|nr:transposase [uncultured Boseongicola sp.]
MTIWLSPEVEDEWLADKRQTPGGQRVYSDLAISVCLTLGMVYKQPLRQTEGLVRGLLRIMGLDLPVPRASTFLRRGSGLTRSMKSEVQRSGPIDLVVDSTGLKIFGEGALSAACCACACRGRNGCTTSMKQRPNASHGANCIWAWT